MRPPKYLVERDGKTIFASDCLEIKLYAEIEFEQGLFEKMQTKKKRTEIISETTTLLILKNSTGGARQSWCDKCAAEVFWIAPTEIDLFGISELPQGAVHTNAGRFCSRSLIDEIKKGEKL